MQTKASLITFAKRLQLVMDAKKIAPKSVASGIGVDRARVSNWLNEKVKAPRRETIQNLAEFIGCNIEWLASGEGEPFPTPKTEPAGERRFLKRRQADLEDEAAAKTRRDRFKMQCLGLFDELYDFVGDRYGEDRDAVNDFLDELEKLNSNFRTWRDEKKQAKDSTASLRGGAKIAKNG